jgi:hypothetical protein
MKFLLKGVFVLSLLFIMLQCSENPVSTKAKEISEARLKWNKQGYDSYTFNYNRSCFCPWASVTFNVKVISDKITYLADLAGNVIVDSTEFQYFYTIDRLFDLLEEADKQNAAQLDYSFNKDFGYPEHIYVDYSEQIADDESSFTIDSLKVLN